MNYFLRQRLCFIAHPSLQSPSLPSQNKYMLLLSADLSKLSNAKLNVLAKPDMHLTYTRMVRAALSKSFMQQPTKQQV